jgi:hypothetical protein
MTVSELLEALLKLKAELPEELWEVTQVVSGFQTYWQSEEGMQKQHNAFKMKSGTQYHPQFDEKCICFNPGGVQVISYTEEGIG